ncbi:hypothetical protein D3C87_2120680 [compost metagenome]
MTNRQITATPVTEINKCWRHVLSHIAVLDENEDVDFRFCGKASNGGAADVVNFQKGGTKCLSQAYCL